MPYLQTNGKYYNMSGKYFISPSAPVPPVSPNGDCSALEALALSATEVRLNWTNGSNNEDGISIERSSNDIDYTEIYRTGAGVITYVDTNVGYYYRVRAFKGALYSQYSNVARNTIIPTWVYTVGGEEFLTLFETFNDINIGGADGTILVQIVGNTTETGTAVLNANGIGNANYSSILIYPTVPGLNVTFNADSDSIVLNGASNVTFDGRVNRTGSANLSLKNNAASYNGSTVRFTEGAASNTIKYCNILGSTISASSGIIWFSDSSTTGNNNNLIINNNITSLDSSNKSFYAIYSNATNVNASNGIINNNIYDTFDVLNAANKSGGIFISSGNQNWTISGNSFYETNLNNITYNTTDYFGIKLENPLGTFAISGNYIGGSAPLCGGNPLTKPNISNNNFYGIYVVSSTGAAVNIQNNTIRNFNWINSSTGASWNGIYTQGIDQINILGNTIGSSIGTADITYTVKGLNTLNYLYGIKLLNNNAVCENNVIGSIKTYNDVSAGNCNFAGIYHNVSSGITTISNNLIGSNVTPYSIDASSLSLGLTAQVVFGIFNEGAIDELNIIMDNNIISNMINRSARTSTVTATQIQGIRSLGSINTISNNIVHDLISSAATTSVTFQGQIVGIVATGLTSLKTIIGNTIYNLSNSFPKFNGGVIGITINANASDNIISNNFIHSLSIADPSINANIITPVLYGIRAGGGTVTYANNIINLSSNNNVGIYGIYETGIVDYSSNLYFNTVSISGTLPSGSIKRSYALWSNLLTNTRDIRNNIFSNTRSTTDAAVDASLHYAAWFNYSASTNLTLDYNNYYVSGLGGHLGNFKNTVIDSLPLILGLDANSLNTDPTFVSDGSTVATAYKVGVSLPGTWDDMSITTDFGGVSRIIPTIGAWE